MNRITHFEFVSDDLEKTAAFYRDVFGWQIQKWEGPVDYWLVTTGETGSTGINGGLMEGPAGTINTIEVDNIDEAITKVVANGGTMVIEKDAIPGVGYQAYFRDNSGIMVGLHQADPNASIGG